MFPARESVNVDTSSYAKKNIKKTVATKIKIIKKNTENELENILVFKTSFSNNLPFSCVTELF